MTAPPSDELDIPFDEIPAVLPGSLPTTRSADLAIGFGPILVFQALLVLRFEAVRLSDDNIREVLLTDDLGPDVPAMRLRCFAHTGTGDRIPVETSPLRCRSSQYGHRSSQSFGITDAPRAGTLTIAWSYPEYGISAAQHDVDLDHVERLRSRVTTAFPGVRDA